MTPPLAVASSRGAHTRLVANTERKVCRRAYKRRPRRPEARRVESEGIGVTSSMRPILMPPRASALSADCAPGPGVFVRLPP